VSAKTPDVLDLTECRKELAFLCGWWLVTDTPPIQGIFFPRGWKVTVTELPTKGPYAGPWEARGDLETNPLASMVYYGESDVLAIARLAVACWRHPAKQEVKPSPGPRLVKSMRGLLNRLKGNQ